jgi:excisionase family DNA binding protein
MLPADWEQETLLTPTEAAERLRVSYQTVYRLFEEGRRVRGQSTRVRLECVSLTKLYTSVEALTRFVQRCSPVPPDQVPTRTPAQVNRAADAATRRLLDKRKQARRPREGCAT